MSDKQLAYAVEHNIPVTFRLLGSNPTVDVTGWVSGMDDYHWSVVDADNQVRLIHKGTALVEPGRESQEPPEEVEKTIAPFRKWVSEHMRGKSDAPQS